MRPMPTTVLFEDAVASVAAEAQDEDLWLPPSELERLGWALEPEGLCRGPLCVPIPPARRAEFVRADGAVNLAALARHLVAELYGWVNVPSNAWIDEEGRIVRPNDPGFAGEYFRGMMDPDFDFKAMMKEYGRMRDRYLDAVRDWVAHGPGSRWALTPEQVRARMAGPNPDHARAAAHFRLGTFLRDQGRSEAAQEAFAEAKRLRPESWNFKRQAWHLEEPGKSGGPEV